MKIIDPLIFTIAFSMGILYIYLSDDPNKQHVIVKYPTIYNAGKIKYRDDADMCYTYDVIPATCPVDKSVIYNVPLQTELQLANAANDDGINILPQEPLLYRVYKYLFIK